MERPAVLVLDDDPNFLELLGFILEGESLKALLHSQPDSAREAFLSEDPLLILLDLNLGLSSGLDFLAQLPRDPEKPFSIIVTTGYGDTDIIEKCFSLGIEFFLRKPINLTELRGMLRAAVASQRDRRLILSQKKELEVLNRDLSDTTTELLAKVSILNGIQDRSFNLSIFSLDSQGHYKYFNPVHELQAQALGNITLKTGTSVSALAQRHGFWHEIELMTQEASQGGVFRKDLVLPGGGTHRQEFWEFSVQEFKTPIGQVLGYTFLGLERTEAVNQVAQLEESHLALEQEMVQSQNQLSQTEFALKIITDNIGDMVAQLALDGRIRFASPSWFRNLGFPIDQVIGKSFQSFICPVDLESFQAYFQQALENPLENNSELQEIRIWDAKQNPRWVEYQIQFFVHPVEKSASALISLRDIHQKKISGEFLRRAFSVLQQSPLPMEMMDLVGNVSFVNQAFLKLFDFQETEVLGRPFRYLKLQKKPNSSMKVIFREVIKLGIWRTEEPLTGKGEEIIPCIVTIFPVRNDRGVVKHFTVFYDDQREKKRVEEELDRREQALLMQSRQAQLGELLNMIAHQWRQPLTVISSLVGNLEIRRQLGTCDPDFLGGKLEKISQTVQVLSDTIESFRTFYSPSRIKTVESLQDLVRRTLEILGPSLVAKGILVQEPPQEPRVLIKVMAAEIMQVIMEILCNARDALDSLGSAQSSIWIGIDFSPEGKPRLTLANNGGSIDNEILGRIFLPYFTTKTQKGGTGLGLYMARMIVEDHHKGRIWVESEDPWTRFILEFPEEEV